MRQIDHFRTANPAVCVGLARIQVSPDDVVEVVFSMNVHGSCVSVYISVAVIVVISRGAAPHDSIPTSQDIRDASSRGESYCAKID